MAQSVLDGLPLLEKAEFTKDATLAAHYWTIRNGLLPSIGGARPSGTSLILEDVCFPPDKLADGALDLQALFPKHDYHGVVFGHASAGNLHFLITPWLNTEADVERFDGFLRDVVTLVVDKYDGSLKAEHGTGRNIAPFVEHEWGTKLTDLMWKVKRLAIRKTYSRRMSCSQGTVKGISAICILYLPSSRRWTGALNADTASLFARAAISQPPLGKELLFAAKCCASQPARL